MPYTEAFLMEVLRHSSLAPIGVFHTALFDAKIRDFKIPKNSWVIANLYGVHYDKEIWGDPENFRPERFITSSGKVMQKPEALIPFSVGKRQCLGESLARDTLFLFATSIFQKFDVFPDPNNPKTDGLGCGPGFLRIPSPFTVIMKERVH